MKHNAHKSGAHEQTHTIHVGESHERCLAMSCRRDWCGNYHKFDSSVRSRDPLKCEHFSKLLKAQLESFSYPSARYWGTNVLASFRAISGRSGAFVLPTDDGRSWDYFYSINNNEQDLLFVFKFCFSWFCQHCVSNRNLLQGAWEIRFWNFVCSEHRWRRT